MKLSDVHGTRKRWNPHKILEKQLQPVVKPVAEKKPRLGQGRVGIKRKVKIAPPSQKKEDSISQGFLRPKPITSVDEAVLAVDPLVPVPFPEIPRR